MSMFVVRAAVGIRNREDVDTNQGKKHGQIPDVVKTHRDHHKRIHAQQYGPTGQVMATMTELAEEIPW